MLSWMLCARPDRYDGPLNHHQFSDKLPCSTIRKDSVYDRIQAYHWRLVHSDMIHPLSTRDAGWIGNLRGVPGWVLPFGNSIIRERLHTQADHRIIGYDNTLSGQYSTFRLAVTSPERMYHRMNTFLSSEHTLFQHFVMAHDGRYECIQYRRDSGILTKCEHRSTLATTDFSLQFVLEPRHLLVIVNRALCTVPQAVYCTRLALGSTAVVKKRWEYEGLYQLVNDIGVIFASSALLRKNDRLPFAKPHYTNHTTQTYTYRGRDDPACHVIHAITVALRRAATLAIAHPVPDHALQYNPQFNNETFETLYLPRGLGAHGVRDMLEAPRPEWMQTESLLLYTYLYHHDRLPVWDKGSIPDFDLVLRSFEPSEYAPLLDVHHTAQHSEVWILPNADSTEWTVVITMSGNISLPCSFHLTK